MSAYDALALEADGLLAGEAFMETSLPALEDTREPIPQEQLSRYKRMFSDAREHTLEARRLNQIAFDYYDNKQWTSDEIKVLNKRRQPPIWINRIAPAVNGVLGVLEQGASDPRAYPRNNEDTDAAEIATDSLRYAADMSRWGRVKLKAAKDYLIGGTCACLIEIDDQMDVTVTRVRWAEFFADPHSQEDDFSDARYLGIAKWMYRDDLAAMYPEETRADGVVLRSGILDAKDIGDGDTDDQDEDKPQTTWGDAKRNRVLVCEIYHNEGGWKRCVYYGGGILEVGPSPYLDERGEPSCPIVAQSPFVDRDNQRYGIVRAMVPIQDEINMRRSRLLHLTNSRSLQQTVEGMGGDVNEARAEAARPDAVIPYGFAPITTTDQASGQAQLLQESKSELERMGANPAVLGRDNADSSGRAHLIRQQAGLTELTPALGGIEDFELRVYRQFWARIKQFWQAPKLIRVTDDLGAPKFLTVNEPVLDAMGQPQMQVVQGPDGQPVQQPVMKNRPAETDVDIIIDSTPDTVSVQQEQFQEMVKLAGVYGPQEIPFDDILEASSLPRKRELLEKRQARKEEAMQAMQAQQQPDPLMQATAEADIGLKQAQAQRQQAAALKDFVATVDGPRPNTAQPMTAAG